MSALASELAGCPRGFVSADVLLDGEPVIGSFTVDGMTFAVTEGSDVELVGVSEGAGASPRRVVASSQGLSAPLALPDLGSTPAPSETDAGDGGPTVFAIPNSVSYEGVDYAVTSIGAYAFYLSGATSVELPASIAQVDDRAFRSSDVASVSVVDSNATYSSFDGALYDADQLSLLLIPEGKQGAVLLPDTAEEAKASVFSHCSLVDAISVEGGAALASENGLLYDASLTALLRVPAGVTDIAIRDGCTTIAAGAMEACASLETITAPASVTSISPDVFTSVPTVSLPAVAAVTDDPTGTSQADEAEASAPAVAQLTAMVALSSTDDDLPEVDPASIDVFIAKDADGVSETCWEAAGFRLMGNSDSSIAQENDSQFVEVFEQEGVTPIASLADSQSQLASGYHAQTAPISNSRSQFICWPTTSVYNTHSSLGDRVFSRPAYQWNDWAGTLEYYRFYDGSFWHAYNANGGGEWNRYGVNTSRTGVASVEIGDSPLTLEPVAASSTWQPLKRPCYISINGAREYHAITWEPSEGTSEATESTVGFGDIAQAPSAARPGHKLLGWFTRPTGGEMVCDAGGQTNPIYYDETYYAQWERVEYDLGFDVNSEPGDEDYPGIEKPDETVNVENGPTAIEDPQRPGYVFQGWVIPSTDGTEAIDQDLVYQDETDGKWYVDASKLPDYANDEGRVELTARWTSVISVDVPSAVTFYADVVTQGNESREGAASSAFGQNKVASQSEVDLRIVGLESAAVATQGSTLGADSILKKSSSATPSSSTQKLFSLYPTDKALTPDDLQDPDAVSTAKPADAVDFALDDLLLEKSFAADAFTIPAGDTLNLGYRLNLSETGTELDYDTLSTLDEGTSASIANISYAFAAGHMHGSATGSTNDDIYIEYDGKVYGTGDILGAAECIAELGEASPCYALYDQIMRAQGAPSQGLLPANAKAKVYARYTGSEATATQPNCKREGYVRLLIVGLNQDALELSVAAGSAYDCSTQVSKRAGITFQFMDALFDGLSMNLESETTSGGWRESHMRTATLAEGGAIASDLAVYPRIKEVYKFSNKVGGGDAGVGGSEAAYRNVIGVTQDRLFLLSFSELAGGYIPASGGDLWLNHEGSQYAYWRDACGVRAGASQNVNWDTTLKLGGDGAPRQWWTRLARIAPNGFCNVLSAVVSGGVGWDHLDHRTEMAIAPAFCL